MAHALFTTLVYEASLADKPSFAAFNAELEAACRSLADEDRAGRAWCKANGYGGYTSYASLDDLPRRDERVRRVATQAGSARRRLRRSARLRSRRGAS